jgi:Tol biopolymer transport system component
MAATTPPNITAQGTILGTFRYMAPEQIEGSEADARSDLWAFGCVLLEMLTGAPAFEGKTQAGLMAAILEREPAAIGTTPPSFDPSLDRIVRRCLSKDPERRWQSARDLRLELEWARTGQQPPPKPAPPTPARAALNFGLIALTLASVIVAALSLVFYRSQSSPPASMPLTRFTIEPPPNGVFTPTDPTSPSAGPQLAVSPDGRGIAFVVTAAGRTKLWLRWFDSVLATAVDGTDGAALFWSPDGRALGFFADGKLKKIQLPGGVPQVVATALDALGGTWSSDNVIVYSPSWGQALNRVSASGGTPAAVTKIDATRHEIGHVWPQFLPDGRHFLYLAAANGDGSEIRIASIDSEAPHSLARTASNASYASSGHILFGRDEALIAQRIDLKDWQLTGDPVALSDRPGWVASGYSRIGLGSFSTGAGALAYGMWTRAATELVWFDRSGRRLGALGSPGVYFNLVLSPDERRVAISTVRDGNRDIWLQELGSNAASRFTFDPAGDMSPVWSPDGSRIVFTDGDGTLRVKAATGDSDAEVLLKNDSSKYATSWSMDGRFILYDEEMTAGTQQDDLMVLPLRGDPKPFPFAKTPALEAMGHFSPDGHWVAYMSNESGRPEIYVQPFPQTGGKWQVSFDGGAQPLWRQDGKELFFLGLNNKLMVCHVDTSTGFRAQPPVALFDTGIVFGTGFGNRHPYAVSRDGQRILVNHSSNPAGAGAAPITVVLNWPAAIKP